MDQEQFKDIVNDMFEKCKQLLINKNVEYARGQDKLHNFKKAARFRNIPDEEALAGMMLKHTTSVYDYIDDLSKDKHHNLESWDEKIVDHINYLLLLRGLLEERYEVKTSILEE